MFHNDRDIVDILDAHDSSPIFRDAVWSGESADHTSLQRSTLSKEEGRKVELRVNLAALSGDGVRTIPDDAGWPTRGARRRFWTRIALIGAARLSESALHRVTPWDDAKALVMYLVGVKWIMRDIPDIKEIAM
jgi:hypothetical protein